MTENVAIDPIIPKSLVDSIKDAFGIQASCPIEIKSVTAVPPSVVNGIDIISIIGVQSAKLRGTFALCFPKVAFLGIVNKMLGETFPEINNDNADAAGELLNITYAGARVKINQAGHDFQPAIPSVVRGNDIIVAHGEVPLIVRVNCQSEFGPFHAEISLRKKS